MGLRRKPSHRQFAVLVLRVASLSAVLVMMSCSRASNSQAAYMHAQQAFLHGDVIRSQQEAEEGYRRFQNSDLQLAEQFRMLEAESLTWRGLNQEVVKLLDSGSGLKREDTGVQILALSGGAHARLHEFAEAERELDEGQQQCKASLDAACGEVLRACGNLAWERGQLPGAKQFYQQSLAFARAHNDRFLESSALLNLGAAALHQDHFEEAIDWLAPALQLSSTLDAGLISLNAVGNLGWAYFKLGDSEKALESFLQALQRATQLGSVSSEVAWLATTGSVYLDAHDYVVAERSYQRALDLSQQINSKEDILNALMSLALVAEQTEKLDQADQYATRAITMARADKNRLDELYPFLVTGHVAAQRHETEQAERIFNEVAQDPQSNVSLKWEAEHALARLYEGQSRVNLAEQEYRKALTTFETARSALQHEDSQLPFLTNAERIYDDYIHFLVANGKSVQALQFADYSRARTLTEGLGLLKKGASSTPGPLDAQQIARGTNGTILFYWLGEKQSYLWAITPQTSRVFPLPSAVVIDAAVQRYRKTLLGPQDVLANSDDGIALFNLLVAPASHMLHKDAQVIIIPDGSLNSLNFETLIAPTPKPHYWIEDVIVSTASSLRLLAASRSATNTRAAKLLLFGDVVAPNNDYAQLPKAAVEMESVEKHFLPAMQQVFAHSRANPTAYMAAKPEDFSYIHFVAHGTASRLSPLDSAIVLSKSTAEDDSFKLYARDIIHHPLHAELVTISTCYGAGARAYSGEGMVGLSWAFLRAGAHNVIGALWEVSDASTPQLMDELYRELKEGKHPNSALREAKLSLLHSKSTFRQAFYWAPFQLYTGS